MYFHYIIYHDAEMCVKEKVIIVVLTFKSIS
jgi:hypothetical protein